MMRATSARLAATLAGLALAGSLGGCLERKLSITTDPPGAIVYVNDVEVGRTPLEADFTFYGQYDVRAELEGYEPLRTKASADAPIYEIPPLDIIAMALPFDFEKTIRWHFALQPALETTQPSHDLEEGLVQRAKELREMTAGPQPVKAEPAKPESATPEPTTENPDPTPANKPEEPAPK